MLPPIDTFLFPCLYLNALAMMRCPDRLFPRRCESWVWGVFVCP